MNLDALLQLIGFMREAERMQELNCPMCKLICEELGFPRNPHRSTDVLELEQEPTTICCSLMKKEGFNTALHIVLELPLKEGLL
jgi:hypothetical protein